MAYKDFWFLKISGDLRDFEGFLYWYLMISGDFTSQLFQMWNDSINLNKFRTIFSYSYGFCCDFKCDLPGTLPTHSNTIREILRYAVNQIDFVWWWQSRNGELVDFILNTCNGKLCQVPVESAMKIVESSNPQRYQWACCRGAPLSHCVVGKRVFNQKHFNGCAT